jgi:hypothetical protein
MTESVLELIPTGGSIRWDQMGLGYDTTLPIMWSSNADSSGTSAIFSLQDAAVAGAISKIVIAYRVGSSEAFGKASTVYGRMHISGAYYETAGIVRAENDITWYYVDVAVNPATSAAWTWTQIDALEAGIKVTVLYGGWLNMYQFKIQVYYTPEAYVPPMLVKGSPACGCGSMIF